MYRQRPYVCYKFYKRHVQSVKARVIPTRSGHRTGYAAKYIHTYICTHSKANTLIWLASLFVFNFIYIVMIITSSERMSIFECVQLHLQLHLQRLHAWLGARTCAGACGWLRYVHAYLHICIYHPFNAKYRHSCSPTSCARSCFALCLFNLTVCMLCERARVCLLRWKFFDSLIDIFLALGTLRCAAKMQ